jgi:hypothetical protein
MQHTKALLLMEKYEIKDYTSQALIVSLTILACLFMILVMVEHSSVDLQSPIYLSPSERWQRILPLNFNDMENNRITDTDY